MDGKLKCAVCKQEVDGYSFCSACGANFCDNCWGTQIAHQPDNLADLRHERSDRRITKRLQGILTPTTDHDAQKKLHLDDSHTTWLKWTRGFRQEPEIQEYDRYKKLIQASFSSQWKERWPQFVSFIGQTGDGKSTIIKMLIESHVPASGMTEEDFPTPVVGGIGTSIPTSADIHLYMDPESTFTQFPRILADCEGLAGGDKTPMAHGWLEDSYLKKQAGVRFEDTSSRKIREKIQRGRRRKLKWACTDEKRRREFTVQELYPRLLYTYSNVVVFVLANERTFETHAFVRLLDWAATSIQSATNQSVLPHVIVVLNKSSDLLEEGDFDVGVSTNKLLSDADQSLEVNPSIFRHVQYWRSRGRNIRTAKDLLACFYYTINVIRIPQKGRWMLIDRQVKRLRDLIATNCRGSHEGKLQARRDLNAEELGECLQSGLDHFTSDLDKPFDFLAFSWSLNPIAPGLEGNILRLALWVKDSGQFSRPEEIFGHLSHMVASCIMLDFVRFRKRGTPLELFEHYKPFLDGTLRSFCNTWWPCSYRNAKGKRCVNTKEGHAKGHQDEDAKPLGEGKYQSTEYQSDFDAESYRLKWHSQLEGMLQDIHRNMVRRNLTEVSRSQDSEAREATDLHRKRIDAFYSSLGGANRYFTNVACLSCLRDMPEHVLPCGHVICSKCVRTFGTAKFERVISLDKCPLSCRLPWRRAVQISLKPDQAGVRVLCLDGGGIRGIVELAVLREIEQEIGHDFHVQDFFDLIVGTSTGGIIALGIGVQDWPVTECISKFKSLCGQAFTERELHGYPLLGKWAMVHHRSTYKTRPFEAALKGEFGQDDDLFGGFTNPRHYGRHVAVTTTTGVGNDPRILTNYNRQRIENPEYSLERPEKRASELKVWQAARATSAAPPYFKLFRTEHPSRELVDGAVHHNNPVIVANAERKYIWPDVDNFYPDILLSIGTGKSSNYIEAERALLKKRQEEAKWLRWVPKMLQILFAKMHDVLDAEKTWQKFIETIPPGDDVSQRYIRINPDLRFGVPALDDKGCIGSLETNTKQSLSYMNSSIQGIADRLIASCFYFEKATGQPQEVQILGRIQCRFEDGSSNLCKLGRCLQSFQSHEFSPRFTVTEEALNPDPMDTIPIPPKTVDEMINLARFYVPEPTVHISGPQAKTTIALILRDADPPEKIPISGFPRQLKYEDEIQATRQKTTREAIRHAQSKLHLRSPSPHRSISNSSRGRSLRWPSSPKPDNEPARPNSAPEPASIGASEGGDSRFPESADDVGSWVNRQSQQATDSGEAERKLEGMVELQGSFDPKIDVDGDNGDAWMGSQGGATRVPLITGNKNEWHYHR